MTVNTRVDEFVCLKTINRIQNREGFSSVSCTCEPLIIPNLRVTGLNENATCARGAGVQKCILNCVCVCVCV